MGHSTNGHKVIDGAGNKSPLPTDTEWQLAQKHSLQKLGLTTRWLSVLPIPADMKSTFTDPKQLPKWSRTSRTSGSGGKQWVKIRDCQIKFKDFGPNTERLFAPHQMSQLIYTGSGKPSKASAKIQCMQRNHGGKAPYGRAGEMKKKRRAQRKHSSKKRNEVMHNGDKTQTRRPAQWPQEHYDYHDSDADREQPSSSSKQRRRSAGSSAQAAVQEPPKPTSIKPLKSDGLTVFAVDKSRHSRERP